MATQIKESIARAPAGRTRRAPLARKQILNVVGKDPNYEYRVVNDIGDRVSQKIEEGYEHVPKSEVKVGDKRVENASAEGSVTQLSVGQGQKAFVMRIRKDWYEEDQAAKQEYVAETERATKKQALDGNNYGKLEITRS